MSSRSFPVPLSRNTPTYQRQSGVILAVTLIVLVIMLVSSVAMIRSFTTSVGVAGALANRRDLMNQSERAVGLAVYNFSLVGPITQAMRLANAPAYNYSACQLPVDVHGVPTILSDDTNFGGTQDTTAWPNDTTGICGKSAVAMASNDIGPDPVNHVTVRYVIDRLCVNGALYSATGCTTTPEVANPYVPIGNPLVAPPSIPIYRVSIRSTDERGSRTYLQTTFSN